MKMKKIKTLQEIEAVRAAKGSVVILQSSCWRKPCPAAFVINQQGHVLLKLIRLGMYVYTPKKSRGANHGD